MRALKIDTMTPIDRIFYESETPFGVIGKISDDDLKSLQGNMNISSENRARINYELRVRSIELPKSWKL